MLIVLICGSATSVRTCSYSEIFEDTLLSQPLTARNMSDGCQTTFRMPNPGSGSGLKLPSTSPARDKMNSLYCRENFTKRALQSSVVMTDLQRTFPDSYIAPAWRQCQRAHGRCW